MEAPRPASRLIQFVVVAYFAFVPFLTTGSLSLVAYRYADVLDQWQRIGMWAWVVPLSIVLGLGILPNTVVALAGGYLFGIKFFIAFLLIYAIALSIGYFVARWLPDVAIHALLRARPAWRRGFENLQNEGLKTVILLRLSPVFPFGITNLVLGWLEFRFWPTLLGSMIGMTARALLLIYLGSKASGLKEILESRAERPELLLVAGLFTGLAFWGLYSLWKKKKPNRKRPGSQV